MQKEQDNDATHLYFVLFFVEGNAVAHLVVEILDLVGTLIGP
jgi:hypothetical protein